MAVNPVARFYGELFDELSYPERLAVARYLEAFALDYPVLAAQSMAGPGNEGTVYVYAPLPPDTDENIKIHERMAEVSVDILVDTGVSIALMPAPA